MTRAMDIWSSEKRSEVMSRIRNKGTKPEASLRKALFARGFRYRVNVKTLPGKPDIVLPQYKTVIFVHGCFWHGHPGCKYAYTPKSNTVFKIKLDGTLADNPTENPFSALMGDKENMLSLKDLLETIRIANQSD